MGAALWTSGGRTFSCKLLVATTKAVLLLCIIIIIIIGGGDGGGGGIVILLLLLYLILFLFLLSSLLLLLLQYNRIQRHKSRFFTISSLRCESSPTRTFKWHGCNRVQITCNTSSAYHVQHVVLRAT